jgi:methionyl-tRNA formyltransferase
MSLVTSPRIRIAYLGLPLGALALARAGFAPCAVALGHPDAPGARRVRRRLGARSVMVLGRPDLGDAGVRRALASARPDVLLSWFWPQRIPEQVLALAPRGAFGVHPSLLPALRGPDPYFWAIYLGLAETGITLHRLDREYDTGHIVAAERMAIAPDDTGHSLARKLDRPSLALLVRCAQRLAAGEALEGQPQDHARASEAPRPDDALLDVDWNEPAAHIERLVRAAAPYPGATAELGEVLVELLEARVFEGKLPRALEPAEAALSEQGVVVATGRGGLVVRRVRLEDGTELRGEPIARLFGQSLASLPRR